jgi:hypothetical protein
LTILNIVIVVFLLLEAANVLMLYFFPGSRRGNGMGAFKAYGESEAFPGIHMMVRYLVNWVAGTKLIFLALLLIILIRGDRLTKTIAVIALFVSVATFFWRLYPIIRTLDKTDQILPRGYSRTLALLIGGFLLMFAAAILVSIITGQAG